MDKDIRDFLDRAEQKRLYEEKGKKINKARVQTRFIGFTDKIERLKEMMNAQHS